MGRSAAMSRSRCSRAAAATVGDCERRGLGGDGRLGFDGGDAPHLGPPEKEQELGPERGPAERRRR
eukprot:2179549-Prymnesium_polylepis.1